MVPLLQLHPAEVGDSPQGDIEALGHAHLKAAEVHLELGRDRCEPGGPGDSRAPPPPAQLEPGIWKQRRSDGHSLGPGRQSPGTGSGQVTGRGRQTAGQGPALLPRKGLGPDSQVRVRPWPHLLPLLLLARGPGDPHGVTLSLLGVQGAWSRPPGPAGSLVGEGRVARQPEDVRPLPPLLSGKGTQQEPRPPPPAP